MNKKKSAIIGLLLGCAGIAGSGSAAAGSDRNLQFHPATGQGAGVSFTATLPKGYELQGIGPEWYVVEKGTTRPLVLVKFQIGKTVEDLVANGFERVDDTKPLDFADGVAGTVVTGSYQAPPEEEYVQPWYLHPAPGEDGIFMIAEYRAQPWAPFQRFAESFRQE
ncbi:MAG: hypothetical protein U5K43_13990 [Halofilum sp. (in: g-proteobacteria)]|nr:hypothetical protein [Halofilum sp. (in: g-proteobacteria)]